MSSSSAHSSNSAAATIRAPFSQSWIQALTVVADNPLARTIKPKMELINTLTHCRDNVDRIAAAKQLWELAAGENLTELLGIVPIAQAKWVFASDDIFMYHNAADCSQVSLAKRGGDWNCEVWQQALGLVPTEVSLTADVFGGDWASLVRKEAVRLQQAFNMSAVGQATNLQLPCTACWDTRQWSVRFDQVNWVVVAYDDIPTVPRPVYAEMEELLTWLIATAGEATVNKRSPQCDYQPLPQPWTTCVENLAELHHTLVRSSNGFSPWLIRVWHCIWPIVYREQHVLRERADIDHVRRELKICLEAQPRLCTWMFVFAKLICQTQLGTGLGFSADYRD